MSEILWLYTSAKKGVGSMTFIYNGNIIVGNNVVFDPISQMYKISCEEYSYWSSWRRDHGKYGIQYRQIFIFVNMITPHVQALNDAKYNANQIATEIYNILPNYLDYAISGMNTQWIKHNASKRDWFIDRMEIEDIQKDMIQKVGSIANVLIHNAY